MTRFVIQDSDESRCQRRSWVAVAPEAFARSEGLDGVGAGERRFGSAARGPDADDPAALGAGLRSARAVVARDECLGRGSWCGTAVGRRAAEALAACRRLARWLGGELLAERAQLAREA